MKRFLTILILSCLLSAPALAGEIPTSGAPAPPPNGAAAATNPGEIPSVGKAGDIPISGVTREISSDALSALLSVLSFLAV